MLKGEIALKCNEHWLRGVWFLKLAEPALLVEITLRLVSSWGRTASI